MSEFCNGEDVWQWPEIRLNQFQPSVALLYPLKTSGNLKVHHHQQWHYHHRILVHCFSHLSQGSVKVLGEFADIFIIFIRHCRSSKRHCFRFFFFVFFGGICRHFYSELQKLSKALFWIFLFCFLIFLFFILFYFIYLFFLVLYFFSPFFLSSEFFLHKVRVSYT